MLKVFVYEYTCALPAEAHVDGAAALNAEGEAMLTAVLADFQGVPGVEAFTIRDEADEPAAFRAAARRADWSLVIAPEFDHILLDRCRWALDAGSRLLGPSPEAVALCGDKWDLYEFWLRHGVRTPPTSRDLATALGGRPLVVKRRDGAGSIDTFCLDANHHPISSHNLIVQQLVPGFAASVAFLAGPCGATPLLPARQVLSNDGCFKYLGGRVPLPPDLAERAEAIALSAIASIPGLAGYFGVDLILGEDGRDWAIEINPRLTTSYIGLRALAKTNLAEAMLRMAEGSAAALSWRAGTISFTANGQVESD